MRSRSSLDSWPIDQGPSKPWTIVGLALAALLFAALMTLARPTSAGSTDGTVQAAEDGQGRLYGP